MKYLSAPWRWDFICGLKKENACIFCRAQNKNDHDSLICWRGEKFFVILNKYPYSTGHLMIAPYAHCASPEELPTGELTEIWELTTRALTVLREIFKPEGFNIGMNIGKAAGAGVKNHFHLHVVPRWQGDANFMSIVGKTQVTSYDPEKIFAMITGALKK